MGRASMTVQDITPPPDGLRISARTENGFAIASLAGELDVACTPVLREQLLGLLRPRASRLVIDLSRVSFCDASGLAVLVGTGRRARLLGGTLRLAAPAPAVASALRLSGLLRQFDVFPTVVAAIAWPRAGKRSPGASTRAGTSGEADPDGLAAHLARTRALGVPPSQDLREAVTELLAHADAWRDADPGRRFTSALRTLARAQARGDQTALTKAARSLLAALIRYPLDYSPAVAATATDLRHLIGSGAGQPVLA
jgi:anti-sigma B factor antagonist